MWTVMGKIISLGIQKGGCGKTTTTAMIASILSRRGSKVLAVDFDSQGNLTQMLTQRDPYDFVHKTSFEACKEQDPRPYIVPVNENLHVLPAEDFLSKLGSWIFTDYIHILKRRGSTDTYAGTKLLKETLAVVKDEYDYILIDLPPNLGEQTINGMCASDYCIIVMQSEPFCKSAVDRYLETLENMIEKVNPEIALLGIATNMIDSRSKMQQFVINETRSEFGEIVFNTTIHRKTRILEYSFEGIKTDGNNKLDREAQQMYIDLTDEIIARINDGEQLEEVKQA